MLPGGRYIEGRVEEHPPPAAVPQVLRSVMRLSPVFHALFIQLHTGVEAEDRSGILFEEPEYLDVCECVCVCVCVCVYVCALKINTYTSIGD
jgi:hypothetical protein